MPYLKTFRKELRNNSTSAEATLWTLLQKKQLDGRKFRRQHSIGNYIVDFYCPSEKLAIELDGEGHNDIIQAEYDRERDLFLNAYGVKVLRFENKVVFNNPEGLLENIKNEFGWSDNHPALQAPLLEKEGNVQLSKNKGGVPEGGGSNNGYQDIPGYCKAATLGEIKANDYVLTPGRYVGVEEAENDGILFEDKMRSLSVLLKEQMSQSEQLDAAIKDNLKLLGY